MFLTAEPVVAPPALLHNLKHNDTLHERNFIITVNTADRPHIDRDEMVKIEEVAPNFTRVQLTFGYMDSPNVPRALKRGVKFDIMATSFFLNRRSFKLSQTGEMPIWQKRLYVAMTKTASAAHEYYHLPSNRVVELGQQITL